MHDCKELLNCCQAALQRASKFVLYCLSYNCIKSKTIQRAGETNFGVNGIAVLIYTLEKPVEKMRKELNSEALVYVKDTRIQPHHPLHPTPPPPKKFNDHQLLKKKSCVNYTMISDIIHSFSGIVGIGIEISRPPS